MITLICNCAPVQQAPQTFFSLKDGLPLLIAFIVAYIAYQQWLVNRNKLRLDLFEKRFAVYKKLNDLLNEIIKNEGIPWNIVKQNYSEIFESRFLFDNEVYKFISGITSNNLKLEQVKDNLKLIIPDETRDAYIKYHHQIMNTVFLDSERIEDVFMEYLLFENVKINNRWKNFLKKVRLFFKPVYIFIYKLINFRKLRKQKKEYNDFTSGTKKIMKRVFNSTLFII